MLKISIISGSNRINSQSLRISKIYLQKLKAKKVGINLINLAKEKLPLWEEDLDGKLSPHKKLFKKNSLILSKADSFIFVVPEWEGMAPPQVKNLFLLTSNNELAHKPGLIVSVSESLGGISSGGIKKLFLQKY